MGFCKEYKQKMNILIPYYRNANLKESGDGKWSQAHFYYDEDKQVPICSPTYYSGLEKRKVLAMDEVYMFAAHKLGKQAREVPAWDSDIQVISEELYAFMERKEEANCISLLQNACEKLRAGEYIFYYGEVLWLWKRLCAFFMDRSQMLKEEEFWYLDAISGIFEGKLYEIALYYLYVYANYHEDEKIAYVLEKYDYEASMFLPNQRFALEKNLREGKILQYIEKGKQLEMKLKETQNWNQLVILYVGILTAMIDIDREQMLMYIEKLKEMLSSNRLPASLTFIGYMNLGTIFLCLNDFEQSIRYLENTIHLSDVKLVRCAVCICHAYRMCHRSIPDQYLNIEDATKGDRVDWAMYSFFCQLKKQDEEEAKKYLMKKVLPFLEINDRLYLNIIEEELTLLCEQGRGYKAMYDYHQYIRGKKAKI